MLISPKHILISRIDAIGDVMLTIPLAGYLKELFPNVVVSFLGNTYTEPILKYCSSINHIINYSELNKLSNKEQIQTLRNLEIDAIIHVFPNKHIAQLAKQAGIKYRIGTNRRIYHWFTCNRLVNLSRKQSNLHEAQLNLNLLNGLGVNKFPLLDEIKNYYNFHIDISSNSLLQYIDRKKTNIILHTKSKGSAREWGLDNFAKLIEQLNPARFNIILTGTEEEGELYRRTLTTPFPQVIDTSGKLTLHELVQLISASQVLVAASTGPLHIAAALGIKAIGLYAPMRPLFPTRWSPLGKNSHAVVIEKKCNDCKRTKDCACIRAIGIQEILYLILKVEVQK
jgi:heptosyltransferase III